MNSFVFVDFILIVVATPVPFALLSGVLRLPKKIPEMRSKYWDFHMGIWDAACINLMVNKTDKIRVELTGKPISVSCLMRRFSIQASSCFPGIFPCIWRRTERDT